MRSLTVKLAVVFILLLANYLPAGFGRELVFDSPSRCVQDRVSLRVTCEVTNGKPGETFDFPRPVLMPSGVQMCRHKKYIGRDLLKTIAVNHEYFDCNKAVPAE